ncbi:hypothetical protein AC249_AIPGENE376 [Exaiptasia diaphana]|nr:hypothetical protein AC249_AIPGENE376 [Exaiptasia diaphana]
MAASDGVYDSDLSYYRSLKKEFCYIAVVGTLIIVLLELYRTDDDCEGQSHYRCSNVDGRRGTRGGDGGDGGDAGKSGMRLFL